MIIVSDCELTRISIYENTTCYLKFHVCHFYKFNQQTSCNTTMDKENKDKTSWPKQPDIAVNPHHEEKECIKGKAI